MNAPMRFAAAIILAMLIVLPHVFIIRACGFRQYFPHAEWLWLFGYCN